MVNIGEDGRRIYLCWTRLGDLELWGDNPKVHDIPGLAAAIVRYGFQDPVQVDAALGPRVVVVGNGRVTALRHLQAEGEPPPRGIRLDADGEWIVPVWGGGDSESRMEAVAYALDHNAVATFRAKGRLKDLSVIWEPELYTELLVELEASATPRVMASISGFEDVLNVALEKGEEEPVQSRKAGRGCPVCGSRDVQRGAGDRGGMAGG